MAANTIVLFSAAEVCSAVRCKGTGDKSTDIDAVVQDFMDSGKNKYIFSKREEQALTEVELSEDVGSNIKKALIKAAALDLNEQSNAIQKIC